LQVEAGVIVLTKVDLTPDPDWLDLVETDVRQVLEGTVLAERRWCGYRPARARGWKI
jgi:translation elongation factor EF-Tu-like GTPase